MREVYRIGAVDGEVTFFDIQDVEVGPSGDVYVAQRSDEAISVFGSDGRPKGTIGRAGQGPGEFASTPSRVYHRGDTLVVTERFATHFILDGVEVRRVRFRTRLAAESSSFVAGTPLTDGSFLGFRFLNPPVRRFFLSEGAPLRRFSSDGAILRPLAWVEFPPVVELRDDRELIRVRPLASWSGEPRIQAVAARDGASVLILSGLYSERDSFELTRIGVKGDTLFHRSIRYDPVPLSREEKRVLTEGFVASVSGGYLENRPDAFVPPAGVTARRARAARVAYEPPEHYPPVRQMVAGNDGSIWLLRMSAPSPVDLWEVYAETGALSGSVQTPDLRSGVPPWSPRLQVFRATRDAVWGVTVDDFGVPYLHHFVVDRDACGQVD